MSRHGRGKHYDPSRAFAERVFSVVYAGDWARRAAAILPGAAQLRLLRHRLALLPPGTPPLRLAFASDLHVGPTTPPSLLARAFDLLADEAPDVLLLGGDYVFLEASPARVAEIVRLVSRVPARRKIAVLGNHDLWTNHAAIEDGLRAAGVEVLINQSTLLDAPWSRVRVACLDEPWTGEPDAASALSGRRPHEILIVLCHAPDGLTFLSPGDAALFVCGHTHGGHVALPSGPIVVPPGPLSRRYPSGRYDIDGTRLFVSRGIGNTEAPFRLYAPPDVSLFELEAAVG
jgi:predicted MPP superfamily phosphohydrolase